MKKPFTLLTFFCSVICVFAQGTASDTTGVINADCLSAYDSVQQRTARNEHGFYTLIRFKNNQYNFISIDKDRYTKAVFPKGMPAESFIRCYNEKMAKRLDSTFNLSFFEKSDSILRSYDNSGRGYKNAEFPGGPGALQKYINKNITLPKDAKLNDGNNLAQVYYSFIIDEKGKTSDIKLIKSNCSACEEPILEAIKKLPAFNPATEAGKPAKIKYILPYMKKL